MRQVASAIVGVWLFIATGWAQKVEFPLGWYSFEEIAQRLSVGGKKVACAPELRQKMALISLKPREWNEVRTLLQQALDIRISKTSQDGLRWKLGRDPQVVAAERKRRQQLAQYIDQRLQQEHRLMQQLFRKDLTEKQMLELLLQEEPDAFEGMNEQQREQEVKQALETLRFLKQMPVEASLRDWRAHARLGRAIRELVRWYDDEPAEEYRQRWEQFLSENPLESFGFSSEVLRWARQVAKEELPTDFLGSAFRSTPEIPDAKAAMALLALDDVSKAYIEIWVYSVIQAQMRPPLSVLDALEQGQVAREYTITLPPEVVAWCLDDASGQVIPLNAAEPLTVRLLGRIEWFAYGSCHRSAHLLPDPRWQALLSETVPRSPHQQTSLNFSRKQVRRVFEAMDRALLQAYEQAVQQHEAFLRDPLFERSIKAKPAENKSLLHRLIAWAKENQQEIVVEIYAPMLLSEPLAGDNLKQMLEHLDQIRYPRRPYLLERVGSVWVLRNWLAFVDRVVDYPLASLKRLARSEHKYPDWVRFYQETTAEQVAWMLWLTPSIDTQGFFNPSGQRFSVSDRDIVIAWVVVGILQGLPEQERARLLGDGSDAVIEVPLSRLQADMLLNLAHALQQIGKKWMESGFWQQLCLSPHLPEWLAKQAWLRRNGYWHWTVGIRGDSPDQRDMVAAWGLFSLTGKPVPWHEEGMEP